VALQRALVGQRTRFRCQGPCRGATTLQPDFSEKDQPLWMFNKPRIP